MKHKLATALIAISAGGLGLYAGEHWPRPQVTASMGAPPTLSPMAAYPDTAQEQPAAPQVVAQTPAEPTTAPQLSVLHPGDPVFDKLADPAASYADHRRAYEMAKLCASENSTRVRMRAHPCELSPGKWQDAETRKRLITECAEAGDCWADLHSESPEGRYAAFTNQAEFDALEERSRKVALAKADPFALAYAAAELQTAAAALRASAAAHGRPEPPEVRAALMRSLAYEVAANAGIAMLNRQQYDPKTDPDLREQMVHFASLSAQEVKEATNEGLKLAQVFRKAKQSS